MMVGSVFTVGECVIEAIWLIMVLMHRIVLIASLIPLIVIISLITTISLISLTPLISFTSLIPLISLISLIPLISLISLNTISLISLTPLISLTSLHTLLTPPSVIPKQLRQQAIDPLPRPPQRLLLRRQLCLTHPNHPNISDPSSFSSR